MVFCGVPSKACAECRMRRTKCDYLRPSCSQCVRMGRKCNGYRDPVAALFRDESKGFASKRQRPTPPKKHLTTASRKSAQEIDQALAACSTMFVGPSLSDSDQRCGTPPVGPVDESLERTSMLKDKSTFVLDSIPNLDVPDPFDDCLWPNPNVLDFENTEAFPFGTVSSINKDVSVPNHYGAGLMTDSRPMYDLNPIEPWLVAGQDDDIMADDFAAELIKNYNDDSNMADLQVFNERQTTKPLFSTNFWFDFETENRRTLLLPNISLPIDAQAPCYFFANYILENTSYSKGFLDYLPGICKHEETDGFLMEAIRALGLAGLAMQKQNSSIFNSARKAYASALKQLNVALTSNGEALTDEALTTVFLLGLYETNTCSTPQNLKAWSKHIQGAIAMLQLRGKKQLDSPVGRQIFIQWRNQIVTYHLHRRTEIPEFFMEWSQDLLQSENEDESMATSLYLISAKLCAVRGEMKYFRNYSKSHTIVPWIIAIDSELSQWADNCPASERYTTVRTNKLSEFVYDDYFHVYSSLAVASIWNEYRRIRMLCHELLLQHIPHLLEHRAEYPDLHLSIEEMNRQLHYSKEIIESLAKDICASVPFHFGTHLEDSELSYGVLAPKAVCGNLLLRPLYMAGEPRFVSNSLRKWVIGLFKKIAEVMGIKLAASLGHMVRIGIDPDEWEKTS